MIKESSSVCVYNDIGERHFDANVYVRPTVGPCKCLKRFDGHPLLLWHLGKGRFVDYTLLHGYVHKWCLSGLSMSALHQSIVCAANSHGVPCSLTYVDVHKSVCGFVNNLSFDEKKAFSCPDHGRSPTFIVSDGKSLGPLKRKVDHLKELDVSETDTTIWNQSTKYEDRTFITVKKERAEICKLLTGDIDMEQFLTSELISTENGLLIRRLIRYINSKHPLKIPDCYIIFISNVSKNSSVRSLFQVLDMSTLAYLRDFCLEKLDVRKIENGDKMSRMKLELPAIWPSLDAICDKEQSSYLPKIVSTIVLRLLAFREEMFKSATSRCRTDSIIYDDNRFHEHPLMCYPAMKLLYYPKKYQVKKLVDSDLCDKSFGYSGDFCAGFFSVGCGCKHNITFGFEVMLLKESPRNLFRFLMTREIDIDALQCIIVDYACLFDAYTLNREAKLLENVMVLVDGSHWEGQKKLKKSERNGKGGHIG